MIKLFPVFTDHMVLQRNTNNKIFGLDQPAQSIELLFKDRVYHTCTDEIGYFVAFCVRFSVFWHFNDAKGRSFL